MLRHHCILMLVKYPWINGTLTFITVLSSFSERHAQTFCSGEIEYIVTTTGLRFVKLPHGLKWGDSKTPLASSYLLERSEYYSAFQQIQSSTSSSILVTGTPGIGKSLFGWWLLLKLIKDAVANKVDISIAFISISNAPVLLSVNAAGSWSYRAVPTPCAVD